MVLPGSVAGRGENFERAVAEFDCVARVKETRDFPGFGFVGFGVEAFRQIAADHVCAEFVLSILARALRVGTSEVRVHSIDGKNCQLPPTWSL
jgi:hypothetical protein